MKKEEKKKVVEEFVEVFSESGFYLMNFKGLNVLEVTELRSNLREANISMRVVKNTLAKRALEQAGIEGLDSFFVEPTSVVWSKEDSVAPARVLSEFIKKSKKGVIKAGLVEGLLVTDSDIERISKLPKKETFYAEIATLLNSPIVKLARALNGVPQKFARTVLALRDKKESESA